MMLAGAHANADIETDRIAGECAALLTTMNKAGGAKTAIEMADNPNRAIKFGLNWQAEVKKYITAGDKSLIQGMVFSAAGKCRKIGIRSSD